jgi:hypothetical protein
MLTAAERVFTRLSPPRARHLPLPYSTRGDPAGGELEARVAVAAEALPLMGRVGGMSTDAIVEHLEAGNDG